MSQSPQALQAELPWEAQADAGPLGDARLTVADWASWPVQPGWQPLVDRCANSPGGHRLLARLGKDIAAGARVFPAQPLRALALTPPEGVRVVILGQDPYHGPGQAEGLAFSVARGCPPPPSLRNIFKELQRDLGFAPPPHGSLLGWAAQGVLLLNTSLTVREGEPGSHRDFGWTDLTDAVVEALARDARPKVFLLWGAHAQARLPLIQGRGPHAVLCANHPSPLSALRPPQPFIGCGHFSLTNAFLVERGEMAVDWRAEARDS